MIELSNITYEIYTIHSLFTDCTYTTHTHKRHRHTCVCVWCVWGICAHLRHSWYFTWPHWLRIFHNKAKLTNKWICYTSTYAHLWLMRNQLQKNKQIIIFIICTNNSNITQWAAALVNILSVKSEASLLHDISFGDELSWMEFLKSVN